MKRYVVFVGVLVFLVAAYFTHSYLKRSFGKQDTIEWANSLVWAAIGAQSSVKFVEPTVVPDALPEHWIVSGHISLRQGTAEPMVHPYSARVERLCEATERRECWRLNQLVIAGSDVDLTGLDAESRRTGSQTSIAPASPAITLEAANSPVPESAAGQAGAGLPATSAPAQPAAPAGGQVGAQASAQTAAPSAPPEAAASPAASEVATLSDEIAATRPVAAAESGQSAAATTGAAVAEPAEALSPQDTERRQMIAEIQARLLDLGYDPGPVDGLMGPQTKTAIEDYQRKNSFTVNGEASAQLLQLLEVRQ